MQYNGTESSPGIDEYIDDTSEMWIDVRTKELGFLARSDKSTFTHNERQYGLAAGKTTRSSREIVGFYDGWKVARFLKWKPLIYWAVYGHDTSFEMFRLSVLSLQKYGMYDGDILVVTDRARDFVLQYVPAEMAHQLHIHHRDASDILGYTIARYDIVSWESASDYGPILYVDTDVIFDSSVAPSLTEICLENRIIGQSGIGPLWRDMGVGSHMLANDGFEIPNVYPGVQGLCTGTLGIPSIELHGPCLHLFIEAIERYSSAMQERTIGWYDQPTVNYVAYKLLGECPDTISGRVRWGGKNALHGGDRPCGMVHLWGGSNKLQEMNELLQMLGGDNTKSSEWSVYGPGGKMDNCNFSAK